MVKQASRVISVPIAEKGKRGDYLKSHIDRVNLIVGIALFVYTVVVFALPFQKDSIFFMSFAFSILAIVSQIYFVKISFRAGEMLKSKFYGFPIARLGMIYGISQLTLSILFMSLSEVVSLNIPLILYVVLLGGTAIGTITVEGVREELIRQDVELKKNTSTMRSLQSQMNSLIGLCDSETLKKSVEKLAEEVKYSDLVSNEATETIENEILELTNRLQEKILENSESDSNTLIKRIQITLTERNRLCKLNK